MILRFQELVSLLPPGPERALHCAAVAKALLSVEPKRADPERHGMRRGLCEEALRWIAEGREGADEQGLRVLESLEAMASGSPDA